MSLVASLLALLQSELFWPASRSAAAADGSSPVASTIPGSPPWRFPHPWHRRVHPWRPYGYNWSPGEVPESLGILLRMDWMRMKGSGFLEEAPKRAKGPLPPWRCCHVFPQVASPLADGRCRVLVCWCCRHNEISFVPPKCHRRCTLSMTDLKLRPSVLAPKTMGWSRMGG